MAKSKRGANQNTTGVQAQGFTKALVEDVSNYLVDDSSWTQARNAINNSKSGDIGSLGNESSNTFCIAITSDGTPTGSPLTIIGAVHIKADTYVLFSTDDSNNHELGLFREESCEYIKLFSGLCLNFTRAQLITGVSKQNFQCQYDVYWSDGINPDRYVSVDIDNPSNNEYTNPDSPIPWVQNCVTDSLGCTVCTNTNQIDCDRLRLETLMKQPCVRVERGFTGGLIPNGSYYAVVAYAVQEQRVSDYFMPSNVQPLFIHRNTSSSLDIIIEDMDTVNFDQFELVLVQFFNGQTVASKVGVYSTRQTRITIDGLDTTWTQISLRNISLRTSIADKSDGIYEAGNYLLRVGPTDKFDFNYQPLANQISTKWVNVEYPEEYYRDGGNNVGYLRDEVYSFFIRWIYNTGDKTPSFHIPGRPAYATDTAIISLACDINNAEPETDNGIPLGDIQVWQVNNTAGPPTATPGTQLPDGGIVIAEGNMGYWESTELYDDNSPEVWNASAHCWSTLTPWITCPGQGIPVPLLPYSGTQYDQYDLCGQNVRHHKFPDNASDPGANVLTNHYRPGGGFIRVMGVKFENVRPPVDNDGVPISNVVGYEILRGSRVGNETIIAKGMINNMFEYDIDGDNDANVNLITNRKGLYPNYPYNDLRADPFISKNEVSFEPVTGNSGPSYNSSNYAGYEPNNQVSKNNFTFHSPDTQFYDPYLSATELKIYGELRGKVEGAFDFPDKHPEHKLVTDFAFLSSILIGVGTAILAMEGDKSFQTQSPRAINLGGNWLGPTSGQQPLGAGAAYAAYQAVIGGPSLEALNTTLSGLQAALLVTPPPANAIVQAGIVATQQSIDLLEAGIYTVPGSMGPMTVTTTQETASTALPSFIASFNKPIMFYNYLVDAFDSTLRLLKAASKYQQYALQYNSHCWYNGFAAASCTGSIPTVATKRTVISESRYLEPYIQDWTNVNDLTNQTYRINNLFRTRAVAIQTKRIVRNPILTDDSRVTVGGAPMGISTLEKFKKPTTPFETNSSCHYVGLKQRFRNQYGRIESIIQVPVSTCSTDISSSETGVLFNGDTYVGRYTEKNTMFFFYNWLFNQPNGTAYDYRLNKMLPHSTYWMNTADFEWSDFIQSLAGVFTSGGLVSFLQNIATPSDMACLDRAPTLANFFTTPNGIFILKNAFMYLFNSGVRDFYVESSVNVSLRDWGEQDFERFYDPYEDTNIKRLFSTEIIKSGNYFKYDFSLSVTRLFNNLIPWGNTHRQDYNPNIAESCYVYRPNRVLYSLPQALESRKDYWRVFLPLNYKDFRSKVTAIKNINLNGALILFQDESPMQFLGSENLTLGQGTRITIGDGGLFNQPLQYLDNSDRPYGYGSCQNRLSIVSTPVGIFYMSQNQGKIFAVGGQGIQEISLPGNLKWWFAQFLPYRLTDDFPDFQLIDNPVIGIGCQAVYDNENMLAYFCKKDYTLRKDIPFTLTYLRTNRFMVNETGQTVELGDPLYFNDASWTMSYDPKVGNFISYHDWHPTYLLPAKNTFLSVMNNSIWLHNNACDSYCNFYGKDYPFEIEFLSDTVQQMTTLRSIEYQLECYKYAENCYDRYHELDFNFDEAIIYNSEQCSGLLRLNITPKNNAPLLIQYPLVNLTWIDILYSKEENKYRFNQFWDITRDRGEFPIGSDYPPTGALIPGTTILAGPHTSEVIFNTSDNGYVRVLNPNNLDYGKYPTEHKKIRHYRNFILLRRRVSGSVKMLFNIANIKNLNSPR
jgi:hypothetical protein